eukprot:scaffold300855_cov22-Tisochrysis_lutea.AAC.1
MDPRELVSLVATLNPDNVPGVRVCVRACCRLSIAALAAAGEEEHTWAGVSLCRLQMRKGLQSRRLAASLCLACFRVNRLQ